MGQRAGSCSAGASDCGGGLVRQMNRQASKAAMIALLIGSATTLRP